MNSSNVSTYTYINEVDNVVNEYDVSNLFSGYEFEQGKNTPDYTTATVVNNTDDIEFWFYRNHVYGIPSNVYRRFYRKIL